MKIIKEKKARKGDRMKLSLHFARFKLVFFRGRL
jgi:hypothetical protein